MGRKKQTPSQWNTVKRRLIEDTNPLSSLLKKSRNECISAARPGKDIDMHDVISESKPPIAIAGLQSYEYSALEASTHVRLLSVWPGTGEGLSCEIYHVDLDEAPEYEALSYVWGPAVKCCQLIIHKTSPEISQAQQSQQLITSSLYNALRDLRFPEAERGKRRLWADAVCINQDDLDERNIQVQMMGRIYRSASHVVTYIGEKHLDTRPAIKLASQLNTYAENCTSEPPDDRLYDAAKLSELGFPPQHDPSWAALADLMRRPWSSRVWIVQESILNQNMLMVCGDVSFKWSLLSDIALHRAAPAVPSLLPTNLNLEIMGMLRRKSGDLTLLQVLRLCRQLSCTEPRDRIYALLNIAKNIDELDITVNYRMSVTDLYTTVAAKILLAEQSLLLLSCTSTHSLFELPSWVPDWSSGLISDPLGARQCYTASSQSIVDISVNPSQRSISVFGAAIDKIAYISTEVASELAFSDFDPEAQWRGSKQQKTGRKWLEEQIRQMKCLSSKYRSPIDAFWRTLVGNVASDQKTETDTAYEAAFDAWLRMLYNLRRGAVDNDLIDIVGPTAPEVEVENTEPELLLEFLNALAGHWNDRCFCITASGYFGLIPAKSRVEDFIVVLYGGRAPFVLQAVTQSDHFVLAGDCYVHGVMKGEALRSGKLDKERKFVIC